MQPRISMITLGVKDLEVSRAFYEKGLGFPVASAQDDVVFFRLTNLILGLYPKNKLAEDATVPHEDGGRSRFTVAHNVASPEEVDAVLTTAVDAGAELVKPGQKVFWGGYSGYFSDPDGNLWEVAHNPFWNLDEEGNVVIPE